MRTTTRRALVPLIALALIGAACTSDDNDSSDGTAAPDDTEATEETTAAPDDTTAPDDTVEVVQSEESTLDAVQAAGTIKCGTRTDQPGLRILDDAGEHVGFDSDFCRVIAAAVLGDATAVEMVDLETADRFTALQSGEIDVLVRNTTWTATRDGAEGATFLQPNFYDGQGMMVGVRQRVHLARGHGRRDRLRCPGHDHRGQRRRRGRPARTDLGGPAVREHDLIQEAFIAGQCDGWSSDTSQLAGLRSIYPEGPDALRSCPRCSPRSHSPLPSPTVTPRGRRPSTGRSSPRSQAEEFGITSENVDTFADTDDINIQRFLGLTVDGMTVLDPGLGLPTDFAYQVIKQVGNYGEIFERNLAPLGLERGVNALWTDGGLMYSPPVPLNRDAR